MKRIRTVWMLMLLLTAALGVLGCSQSEGGSAAPAIDMKIDMEPKEPVAGQETAFHVSIAHDQDGLTGAQVTMFLEMKEMDHGENKIVLQEESPGVYRGKGTFPMSGEWVAHVRAEKGTVIQSANLPLIVRP